MRKRGQALTEFALVMPVLLFVTMGIFDFGRVLFTYAMASNSLRNALRNAEVLGYTGEDEVFANCAKMRDDVRNVFFAGPADVHIYYQDTHSDPLPARVECSTDEFDTSLLQSGDLLQIDVSATVEFMTPALTQILPNMTFRFAGQRTIVMNVPLSDDFDIDSDYDGLLDQWELDHFGNLDQTGTNDPDGDGCNNGCEETRHTDPLDMDGDTDNDGLKDGEEAYLYKTNPLALDTDHDGLSDGDEIATYNTDPKDPDSDNDGISDGDEVGHGLDPALSDSDLDGLTDGDELNRYGTDPNFTDSELDAYGNVVGDGISDYDEVVVYHTDPRMVDTDLDGLNDYDELFTWGTDALWRDTDGDGLSDGDEVNTYRTLPRDNDTDNDGLLDGAELSFFNTDPTLADTDNDRTNTATPMLNDREEYYTYGTGPTNPNSDDPATCPAGVTSDDLLDADEVYVYGTNPLDCDTNDNGYSDGADVAAGRDPRSPDSDADSLADNWEITYFGNLSQSGTDDFDGDGCTNECEETRLLRPNNPDTDGDGLNDGDEINTYLTIPSVVDTDGDGLSDGDEVTRGTNPNNPDTDGDGISDGDEVNTYGTDPLGRDSDGDGLNDYAELFQYRTLPNDPDSDDGGAGDGLTDSHELLISRTDPLDSDTDDDGLSDGDEVILYGTIPTRADTDGDGLSDYDEVITYGTNANRTDTDGDGLNDYDEVNTYGTDPNDADSDGDGLNDGPEVNTYQTDPMLTDTDDDGLNDGDEVLVYGTEAFNPDTDDDGLNDGDEVITYGTDPLNPDTDGDSVDDGTEVADGTDPLHAPTLSINDVTAREPASRGGTSTARFTVTLMYPLGATVTVNYSTFAGTATECGTSNCDYRRTTGTLSFAPNTTTQYIDVPINWDRDNDPGETFSVILSNPSNHATLERLSGRLPGQGFCTIQ